MKKCAKTFQMDTDGRGFHDNSGKKKKTFFFISDSHGDTYRNSINLTQSIYKKNKKDKDLNGILIDIQCDNRSEFGVINLVDLM